MHDLRYLRITDFNINGLSYKAGFVVYNESIALRTLVSVLKEVETINSFFVVLRLLKPWCAQIREVLIAKYHVTFTGKLENWRFVQVSLLC